MARAERAGRDGAGPHLLSSVRTTPGCSALAVRLAVRGRRRASSYVNRMLASFDCPQQHNMVGLGYVRVTFRVRVGYWHLTKRLGENSRRTAW